MDEKHLSGALGGNAAAALKINTDLAEYVKGSVGALNMSTDALAALKSQMVDVTKTERLLKDFGATRLATATRPAEFSLPATGDVLTALKAQLIPSDSLTALKKALIPPALVEQSLTLKLLGENAKDIAVATPMTEMILKDFAATPLATATHAAFVPPPRILSSEFDAVSTRLAKRQAEIRRAQVETPELLRQILARLEAQERLTSLLLWITAASLVVTLLLLLRA